VLGPDPRGQQPDVVDQAGPAAFAQVAGLPGADACAVATVVLGAPSADV
jgi:hypothetical protein